MGRPRPSRASRAIEEWLASNSADNPRTQEILAERLSVLVKRKISQSSVSNIKSGSQSPRADLVGAFRIVLGIEPEWWLPEDAASGVSLPTDSHDATGTDDAPS